VDRGLGLWLRQLGQAVENIHRFVLPASLLATLRIHLLQRRPKSHGTVSDGQFGRVHSSAFEAKQDLAPTLDGLAHPILDCQEPFLTTSRYPNNHKGAQLVVLAPKAAMDAVSPDIDDWLVIKGSIPPAVVLLCSIALEPRHSIR
jgi:hypothetical protein